MSSQPSGGEVYTCPMHKEVRQAGPSQVSALRHGLAAGRHELRHGPAHDVEPAAPGVDGRDYGCADDSRDDGAVIAAPRAGMLICKATINSGRSASAAATNGSTSSKPQAIYSARSARSVSTGCCQSQATTIAPNTKS